MKKTFLYIQAIFYVLAGINHFWRPAVYAAIMPPWLPWHAQFVYISGILEILFGGLLLPSVTRKLAAWAIIGLLIAVYPANIQMAVNYITEHNTRTWIAIARLPIQFVLVWWAWIYTKPSK
ncbi:MAG: DoxX family protein [Chitinophagaceae bacterium]|nr:DoxX family protein [Chitinophagaceae bacterium]